MAERITLKRLKYNWQLYFLVLPSLLMVVIFRYYPAVSAVYYSFFRWDGEYIKKFVGLANFRNILHDSTVWYGFMVIGILVIANLIKMIPSIITAVVIHRLRSQKAQYIYKVLFVVPMIVPAMVYLLIWKFFYDPQVGVLNKILKITHGMDLLIAMDKFFGWGVFQEGVNPVWLGHPKLIIPSLIFWGFPWIGVVGVLIYLAGLQGIDDSIYEAAEVDGINWFGKFIYIELPLIMTQIRINLIMMIISTLQSFGLILVLFGDSGGPGGVAMVPGLYMFRKAFREGYVGYACAIGIVIFIFILILTEINNRYVRVEK